METHPVHSLVPKLPVSPSRSPSWRTAEARRCHGRLQGSGDEEETTNI